VTTGIDLQSLAAVITSGPAADADIGRKAFHLRNVISNFQDSFTVLEKVVKCIYGAFAWETVQESLQLQLEISRDQPNSRFHGRDIFREIGLLPWKTPISVKSVKFREICDFLWILTLLHSFMKVFRVLSTAFVRILLFATCHTSALSSWHVFTVLLTYIQSWVLT